MRKSDPTDPFCDLTKFWAERGRWPASWVSHPEADGTEPIVMAFKCEWTLEHHSTIRLHVSGDERYELWLDGKRIGRGPERGDRFNWFFQTHELTLDAGVHRMVARVWWLKELAPLAQLSVKPAFLLAAEGDAGDILSTGKAAWKTRKCRGIQFVPAGAIAFTGAKTHIDGTQFDWGWEQGQGDRWIDAIAVSPAFGPEHLIDQPMLWQLRAGTLPSMFEQSINIGVARHVQALSEPISEGIAPRHAKVRASENIAVEADQWTAMLAGQSPLTIPSQTCRRVIVDLQNYVCAYTQCFTSGGKGATIKSWWAENLYEVAPNAGYDKAMSKGNRDEIEGKIFVGIGDTFEPDGAAKRLFTTWWWEAGRYLQILVETKDQPLTIESFSLLETHYPYEWDGHFECDDARFAEVIPLAKRTMEMCTHETFMDCPYHEQLMYVGDTRLEILVAYTWSSDDRMARKALRIYDESRKSPGFTQSRYPSRLQQTIPPFSTWWIAMLHDYMMWRGDRAFVADRMPCVRSVLDAFDQFKDETGLILGPPGWNFLDWVPSWKDGMPIDASYGVSAPLNFQLAWVLQQAAELEVFAGHKELAALHRRRSGELTRSCNDVFWNEKRGLYADDVKHSSFSEHAQCMASLGDSVPMHRTQRVIDGLLSDPDLARATIYYQHYLFEVFAQIGRVDRLIERLGLWFELKGYGFKTTPEQPEPSRSDCHAWAAHPLYHYTATILGIRPGSAGFESVRIQPQLGSLKRASGKLVHDRGEIAVAFANENGKLVGDVVLPNGLAGICIMNGKTFELRSGMNSIS